MNIKDFFTGYKGYDMPKELQEFNWGAFLLTFIWGFKYKAWITFLAIPLIWFQMPFCLNWILLCVLQIYCGFNGNKWAYQIEYWKKPADFRKTQMLWAVFAVMLHVIVPFAILTILVMFINKSPDNPTEIAQNAQCSISYRELKKNFKKFTVNSTTTDSELARQLAKRYENSKVEGNTTTIKLKNGLDFNIIFNIYNVNENCNLSKKNCKIQTEYALPEGAYTITPCTFYFDNNKNILPDEYTQKAIDKGLNIFKYI